MLASISKLIYDKYTHIILKREVLNMKEIKLSEGFLVTLHNDLVQARFTDSMTINEQKILFAVLSNIEPPEFETNAKGERVIKNKIEEIPPFRVPIKEFTEWLGFKDPNYAAFKKTTTNLMKKVIQIEQQDGSWKAFQWVYYAEYVPNEGMAHIEISPKLYPYLLNLERNFTTIRLDVLLSFKSNYSSRLYQLIKKWSKIGNWTVTVEELRKMLGLQSRLKQYGHFKKKALEVAISEINNYSEFLIQMKEHKTGRKVTSLSFEITEKKKLHKPKELENDRPEPSKNGLYAEEFKKAYKQNGRQYYDRKTGEMVLFDDEERAKAIILNNIFPAIGNEACFSIEKQLLKLFEYPEFNVSREINDLFSYTRNATSINNPEAFIVSTLKKLVDNLQKGNTNVSVNNFIRNKGNHDIVPDWYFDGERSKREVTMKEKIKFELTRLENTNLTIDDVTNYQVHEMMKKEPQLDDDVAKSKYEEYIALKESGKLDELMKNKKEELQKLGYYDRSGNVNEEYINELYWNEKKRSA